MLKSSLISKFAGILLIIILVLIGLHNQNAQNITNSKIIYITGASSTSPVLYRAAREYEKLNRQEFSVSNSTDNAGIEKVLSNKADIAIISKPISEKEEIKTVTIGHDGVVAVVNSKNPINSINKEELIKVFSGKIRTWKELNGSNDDILTFSQQKNSICTELFEEYTGLNYLSDLTPGINGHITSDTHIVNSDLDTISFVSKFKGAIGFTLLSSVNDMKEKGIDIKILKLDGITANKEEILSGKYPLKLDLNIVYKADNSKINEFIEFCKSEKLRKILEELKFIPVK